MECEHLPAPQNWDQAAPEDLRDYRLHVRFCRSCRARVLNEAPDQLLFDLQNDPLPQDFWLGFWNSIRRFTSSAGVPAREQSFTRIRRAQRPAPRIPFSLPIRWAAAFLIGFMVLFYSRNLPETEPLPKIELESYPVIENIGNPEARFYIFQSGHQEKIVMVLDPDMEL